MSFHIIIPARLQSSRMHQKVLARHEDMTLLEHTYRVATRSEASRVTIATDHESVYDEAKRFGANVLMTSADHRSGTERVIEAIGSLACKDDEIIINLQADEPEMPVAVLNHLGGCMLADPKRLMATVARPLVHEEDLINPNIVKVILDRDDQALYFSRAPIPWNRDSWLADQTQRPSHAYRHVGLYAYQAGFLRSYPSDVSPIEKIESLEQLRVLWHGIRIHVMKTDAMIPPGIDTAEDWQRFQGNQRMGQIG